MSHPDYDKELAFIGRHMERANIVDVVEQTKEYRDVHGILRTITGSLIGIVVSVVVTVLINVFMLPKTFPQLFCWWHHVYSPCRKHCAPSVQEGNVPFTAYHIAIAITYPSLYSTLNTLAIVPELTPLAAEFLSLCVAHKGKYITPFAWAGTGAQLEGEGATLADWLPTAAQCQSKGSSAACLNNWFQSTWLQSCQQGNPFYQFFPNEAEEFESVQSLLDYITDPHGSFIEALYDGGLVKIARLIGTSTNYSAAGYFKYMFQGKKQEPVPSSKSCGASAAVAGATTGVMTAGGLAIAGMSVSKTRPGLAGAAGAAMGAGLGLWQGLSQKHECSLGSVKWSTVTAPSCDAIQYTLCGKMLPKDTLDKVTKNNCTDLANFD